MRIFTWRRLGLVLVAAVAVVAVALYGRWRDSSNRGGQKYAAPFRIAGNLYYVGANDVTSFLITGPEGHVLIDGGYPGTPALIMGSIRQLGFNIKDVKVLLNSHAHIDHAGGLAELQKASGAQLWVSEGDADVIAAGGAGDPSLGRLAFLSYLPFVRYPPPRIDHRFKDGAKVRVGAIQLTAHVTPGHTPGCTSWSFPVHDGNRDLLAVEICSLDAPLSLKTGNEATVRKLKSDFAHSFAVLRGLPADIFLATHARHFGRYRKFVARASAKDPADPFIDRAGYLAHIDEAERRLRQELGD
jgi:metallo-beta-lactamase class B